MVSGRPKVRDGGTKFKIGLLEFAAPLQIDTDVKMRFGRDDRCCKERETEDAIQITIIASEEVPRPAVYKDFTRPAVPLLGWSEFVTNAKRAILYLPVPGNAVPHKS